MCSPIISTTDITGNIYQWVAREGYTLAHMYITDYKAFIVLYSLAWCAYIIVLIGNDLSMRLLRALNNMLLDSVDMPSSHEPVASSVCVWERERKKERNESHYLKDLS